jgi:hypothetical protein
MPDIRRLLAAAAMTAIASSAWAEEPATMVVNGTTINCSPSPISTSPFW